jgi:hypothetical protein
MPTAGLNGHGYEGRMGVPDDRARAAMLTRIEAVLGLMTVALMESGFSEYEASEVNLNTRFAITGVIKERGRRS